MVNRIYNLIISEHRTQKQAYDLNQFPKHWINFKNGMFDVKEWRLQIREHITNGRKLSAINI